MGYTPVVAENSPFLRARELAPGQALLWTRRLRSAAHEFHDFSMPSPTLQGEMAVRQDHASVAEYWTMGQPVPGTTVINRARIVDVSGALALAPD